MYTFAGDIYLQENSGVSISLDLTGEIAQLFMIWWDMEFKQRVRALLYEIRRTRMYAEDINIEVTKGLPGSRYVECQVVCD